MKRFALYFGLAAALVASCSTQEKDFQPPLQDDVVFYASFEQPVDEGTSVYANEDLLLRWNADDRISIFNKNTYNQQYKFLGETGDKSGGFSKADGAEFVTGNPLSHIVSVYPYQASTKITEEEVVTVNLPAEQHYAENTFGLGANSMISVSSDNVLQYKTIGGYLMLKLYGEGVSVSSITLRGNSGERLAGKATILMPLGGEPTTTMSSDATDVITLTCAAPVELGATAEEYTAFWFVVPPMTFNKGFQVTVSGKGGSYQMTTEKAVTIKRSNLSKMAPIEVDLKPRNNVIYYTSSDGNAITPYATDAFGANIISNEYVNGRGIITFDKAVTSVGKNAFRDCKRLTTIQIPNMVTSIGEAAFLRCTNLVSLEIPDMTTSIGGSAFAACSGLTTIVIPNSVTSIGPYAFESCWKLTSIDIPNLVASIGYCAFRDCSGLTTINVKPENSFYDSRDNCNAIIESKSNILVVGCSGTIIPSSVTCIGNNALNGCTSLSIVIPNSVTSIEEWAFANCFGITTIEIPSSVTNIGDAAFYNCHNLSSITVWATNPPFIGDEVFGIYGNTSACPIYVPGECVEAYKGAWSEYADRIYAVSSFSPSFSDPVPEAIDMGLSVKWGSFNLGASKPEEYGDYYAWGEIETQYYSLEPDWYWKEDGGNGWPSYKWCYGTWSTLTKYCTDSDYGLDSFIDGKTVLDPEDDAAHMHLGGKWRMPTKEEVEELLQSCIWSWTTQNGVQGCIATSTITGLSIFFPAAGSYYNAYRENPIYSGHYYCSCWTSTLDIPSQFLAMEYGFTDRYTETDYSDAVDTQYRFEMLSIRPVYAE